MYIPNYEGSCSVDTCDWGVNDTIIGVLTDFSENSLFRVLGSLGTSWCRECYYSWLFCVRLRWENIGQSRIISFYLDWEKAGPWLPKRHCHGS